MSANGSRGVKITTRKPNATPNQVASSKHESTLRASSGHRRAIGVASGQAKRNYRPDLRRVGFLFFSLSPFPSTPKATLLEPGGLFFRKWSSGVDTFCKINYDAGHGSNKTSHTIVAIGLYAWMRPDRLDGVYIPLLPCFPLSVIMGLDTDYFLFRLLLHECLLSLHLNERNLMHLPRRRGARRLKFRVLYYVDVC